VKLADIARLAQVSVTTASYVINGQAQQRRISPATVQRVLDVVRQHGYRPDQQAASLRRGQSRCLGFILPDLENPSYARLAKLLEQRARHAGYQLLVASSDDDPDAERQVLALFRSRRCDALIVASCLPGDDPTYAQLVAEGLPVIAVDRALDPLRIRSVVSDDRQAALLLTGSLLQPAPRHVALIGARPELPISQAREAGFREALQDFPGALSVVHAEQFSRAAGRACMQALLREGAGCPDALVTTAYVLLEGVLEALQTQDWPDVSAPRLATFGDARLLDFLPLRVTAMAQQHERIAERVLHWIVEALECGAYAPGIEAIPRSLRRRDPARQTTVTAS
jgi:LacI family fructose operon transcriptional repressor